MSVRNVEVETLVFTSPMRNRSVVHASISHPTPPEEASLGKLYLLAEIDSTDTINHDIIGAFQDELNNVYYRSAGLSIEQSFESALNKGNERLHQFITSGVTAWLDNFNAVVAVVKNDLCTFSHAGRIHALLFRGNRIVDIIAIGTLSKEKRNPLKIFSEITAGQLQVHDRVLLCTSSLLDYFSQEKLKRLIVEDLPSRTVQKIERMLYPNPPTEDIAALLFAFLPDQPFPGQHSDAPPARFSSSSAPQRSMDELNQKERATEQLLAPAMLPNLKKLFSESSRTVSHFIRTKIFRFPPRRSLPRTIHSTARYTPGHAIRNRPQVLKRLGFSLLFTLVRFIRWARNLPSRRTLAAAEVKALPEKAHRNAGRMILWFRHLTPMQRILFIASVLVLFVLSQSIINLTVQRRERVKKSEQQLTIQKIEDNISKASAALTYDDFRGAKKLIDESHQLLGTLRNKTRSEREFRGELEATIKPIQDATRRIRVVQPEIVAELSPRLGKGSPTGLALLGSTLLVATNEPRSLLSVDIRSGTVTKTQADVRALEFILPLDARTALLAEQGGTISEFSARDQSLHTLDLGFTNVDTELVAGSVYRSRLYLLDPKNNSILRSNRGASSYGPATHWLTASDVNIRNGASIAVDGNVFVVMRDGALLKFFAGKPVSSDFESVDPRLTQPTHLWTSERSPSLYILEPAQSRIVVFSKISGSLLAQFVDKAFATAQGLSIDENHKVLYLVTATQILKFTLS